MQSADPKRKKLRHRNIDTRAARLLAAQLLPEVRNFAAGELEIRSDGDAEITITGRPIVYNAAYEVRDQCGTFEETMLPGVAADVLQADVRFQFDHDGLPLARTTAGTLVLEDRDDGLHMSARLDNRQAHARDLAIAIERGDISQMSAGFVVADDEWSEDMTQRSISLFKSLLDISAVTYAASPTTNVEIAKRMALQAPVASAVRLVKMATEIRAGKVLSSANQQLLVNAVAAMHTVLGDAGFNLADMFEPDEDDEETQETAPQDLELVVLDSGQRSLELEAEYLALHSLRQTNH